MRLWLNEGWNRLESTHKATCHLLVHSFVHLSIFFLALHRVSADAHIAYCLLVSFSSQSYWAPLKDPHTEFLQKVVHQNISFQHRSKPFWFLSFFWGPRQDKALSKSVKIFFLPFFVLSKSEGPGFVYILLGGQNESALIFTHDRVVVWMNAFRTDTSPVHKKKALKSWKIVDCKASLESFRFIQHSPTFFQALFHVYVGTDRRV